MDTSTIDPLIGTVLDGRYRLDARIARGGMATVYEGFDTRLDRNVAVKVMHGSLAVDDGFVERFRREAKAAARLSHPGVVAIFDQGEDDGRVYLVMEHVTGRTLRELLRESGRLPVQQALDVADGVLSALTAAHAAGLVHRDVKPENVIVTPDGRVKVADFGLARAIEASHHSVADGTLLGTVAYIAPEQVVTGKADPRADLYALGIVLFEMLTGAVPFTADTPLAVAYRHVNEDVPFIESDVPRAVANVVRAATRREAEERYPDAQAMQSAVRRARASLGNADTAVVDLSEAPTLITPLPPVGATRPMPAAPPTAPVPVPYAPPAPPPDNRIEPVRSSGGRKTLIFLAVSMVVLLVAGFAGWRMATATEFSTAPRLVGLDEAAAQRAADAAGLTLLKGTPEYDDEVPAGGVLRQDPPEGARLERGSVVTIVLSRGVRMTAVPAVAGKTEKEARDLLRKAGLGVSKVTREYDEKVPKDRVVSASQAAGTKLKHGSAVALVVSEGPAPVPVPNVRGKSVAEARRLIQAAGLTSSVRLEFSDTVAKDLVIDQAPVGAAKVPRGSTVVLRVSKGPETVRVPDVRGATITEATRVLRGLGLEVAVQHVRSGHGDVVLDQDPQPGAVVRIGTKVTLLAF